MKRISALWICFLILTSLYGGSPIEKWFHGSVVLIDQTVLVGEISVYTSQDVIILQNSEGIISLPAKKISSFFFYDPIANVNRKYVSRLNQESIFKRYQLYEVVLTGAMPVLREQVSGTRGVDDTNDFNYFVLYDNKMIELQKFKRLVYSEISKKSKELLVYVKQNHLNPGLDAHAIRIIDYFNRGKREDILAMN